MNDERLYMNSKIFAKEWGIIVIAGFLGFIIMPALITLIIHESFKGYYQILFDPRNNDCVYYWCITIAPYIIIQSSRFFMISPFKSLIQENFNLVIIISGICILIITNAFLSENNLLIYATGTNEKALKNSTWKMSLKEVKRVNECRLEHKRKPKKFDYQGRQKEFVQDNAFFWGYNCDIKYFFFDNMLYKYKVKIVLPKISTPEQLEKDKFEIKKLKMDILQALREKFGNEVKKSNEKNILHNSWNYKNQIVNCKFTDLKEEEWGDNRTYNCTYFEIEGIYQPIYKQMEEIMQKDKSNSF